MGRQIGAGDNLGKVTRLERKFCIARLVSLDSKKNGRISFRRDPRSHGIFSENHFKPSFPECKQCTGGSIEVVRIGIISWR